jgi:hypothetical protein
MRQPTPVESLVLLNAPHPACFEREVRRWRQLCRSWYMLMFQLPWLPEAVLAAGHARAIGAIFEIMRVHPEHVCDDLVCLY